METGSTFTRKNVCVVFLVSLAVLQMSCSQKNSVAGPVSDTEPTIDEPGKQDNIVTVVPGRFGIARLDGGLKKQSALAAALEGDTVAFEFGDLKATANYFFLLTNAGGVDISDIELSSDNETFTVNPQKITSLSPGIGASLLPILSISAVHGLAPTGVGKTSLMPKGANNANVILTGKTKDTVGNSITIQLTVAVSVDAKVLDLDLSDNDGVMDLSKPKQVASGLHMFSSDYNGALQIYTVWKLPGVFTNTGNVPASIRIAPFSNDSTPEEMIQSATIEPGAKMTIGNEKWPKGTALVVEIDGNNTVAESGKFLQASNGRCYMALELFNDEQAGKDKCPPETPFQCPDGSCVKDESACKKDDQVKCPPETPFQCPDGSCVKDESACKKDDQVKCPPETPFQCPDGSCVKDESACNQVKCPPETPFQCPDGSCVKDAGMCK